MSRRAFLLAIQLLLGWMLSAASPAAEFTLNHRTINVRGTIETGDYEKLIKFLQSQPPSTFVNAGAFDINSNGGSVSEALKLASFVSETYRMVFVGKNQQCVSSCFFIYVAAGMRVTMEGGLVGIHRPYFDPAKFAALMPSEAARTYEVGEGETRRYLTTMHVPDAIVNKMFSTPSSQIYMLSEDELEHSLGYFQPWYQELSDAACSPATWIECMHTRASKERLASVGRFLGSDYVKVHEQELAALRLAIEVKLFKDSQARK